MLRRYFPFLLQDFYLFFKWQRMFPVVFTEVLPVHLARFLKRRNYISRTNNVVKDRVYDCSSSVVQLHSQVLSVSKKSPNILVHKTYPDDESLNRSSFKSFTPINTNTVCLYSTNLQLFMKEQSSQPTICKPKGTAPPPSLLYTPSSACHFIKVWFSK